MTVRFALVGAPRTGSTLLRMTLDGLEGCRCQGELLAPQRVRGYGAAGARAALSRSERAAQQESLLAERRRDPVAFLLRALDRGAERASGFKVLYGSLLAPEAADVRRALVADRSWRIIHLVRGNALRRYVSEEVLRAGGPANSRSPRGPDATSPTLRLDPEHFARRCEEIEVQRARVDRLIAGNPRLDLSYEALAADVPGSVARVADFLGLRVDGARIEPALQRVGSDDLRGVVSNLDEVRDHPSLRPHLDDADAAGRSRSARSEGLPGRPSGDGR